MSLFLLVAVAIFRLFGQLGLHQVRPIQSIAYECRYERRTITRSWIPNSPTKAVRP
jgi:hypothetical protein